LLHCDTVPGYYEALCAEIVRLLREERERRKLSRYAVWKRCGVSQSMLSLVERGQRNPTMELMLRIADATEADLPLLMQEARKSLAKRKTSMGKQKKKEK
jgi:transcriptional regulator with XRE-family HTH domain